MGRRCHCRGLLRSTAERSTALRQICLVMPRSQRRIATVTSVVGWSLIALHKLQSLIVCFLETDASHFLRTVCVMPALKQANCASIHCQAHPVLLSPGKSETLSWEAPKWKLSNTEDRRHRKNFTMRRSWRTDRKS